MEEKPKCSFYNVCGAEVIRLKLDRSGKWQKDFCFGEPEKCEHLPERKRLQEKKRQD